MMEETESPDLQVAPQPPVPMDMPDETAEVDMQPAPPEPEPEQAAVAATLPEAEGAAEAAEFSTPATPPAAAAAPTPPPAEPAAGAKENYWRRILTGDPATVPTEVRRQAGVDEWDMPEEQREYQLLSTVNKSWAADHLPHSREQVRAGWRQQRARLADKYRVRDNEREVFLALSQEAEDAPRRAAAVRIRNACYMAGLEGREMADVAEELQGLDEQDVQHARRLAQASFADGQQLRQELAGLAERIARGVDAFAAVEETAFSAPRVAKALPELLGAADELAELDEAKRNTALYLAAGMVRSAKEGEEPAGIISRVQQAIRRGAANLGMGMVQGLAHTGIATLSNAGRVLESDSAGKLAAAWDKRMQMLDAMRRLSQAELRPLVLEGEESRAASYLINAAEAVPAALLSCCGGVGFSALTLGAVGESVAAARARAPMADQELQLYAGLLAGTIQAGIYMNLNRLGGRLLEQSIAGVGRAAGKGLAGYTLAGLNVMGGMTTEAAKLLAAGKLAGAADLGAQEMAARLSRTASNINWKAFGDNLTDIEANMHEAAGLLPFLLLGSGRLALHHFRSPYAILGEGHMLEALGVPSERVQAIMQEPMLDEKSRMLQESLSSSKLFSGIEDVPHIMRVMGLLNLDGEQGLRTEGEVSEYLNLPKPALPAPQAAEAATKPQSVPPHNLFEAGTNRALAAAMELRNSWWKLSPLAKENELSLSEYEYSRQELPKESTLPFVVQNDQERLQACLNMLESYSNLYLLNIYSLDSLVMNSSSEGERQRKIETTRKTMYEAVRSAVVRVFEGSTREESLQLLDDYMIDFLKRRKYKNVNKNWIDRSNVRDFTRMVKQAEDFNPADWAKEPDALNTIRVVSAMHEGVDSLVHLLPRMPEYQSMLAEGYTPSEAVDAYISEWMDPGNKHSLAPATLKRQQEHNARRFEVYRQLTGFELEEVQAEDGATHIRAIYPDGATSGWYSDPTQAVNDLAGRVAEKFLPLGYRPRPAGERKGKIDYNGAYLAVDQVCSIARHELGSIWMGTITGLQPGMSVRRGRRSFIPRNAFEGVAPNMVAVNGENVIEASTDATPLSMMVARAKTHWRRMVDSGAISHRELGNALVEREFISREELESIMTRPAPTIQYLRGDKKARQRMMQQRLDEHARSIRYAVADRAAMYTACDFLARQGGDGFPQLLNEWLGLLAFHPGADIPFHNEQVLPGKNGVGITNWANRSTARQLVTLAPMVDKLRRIGQERRDKPQGLFDLLNFESIGLNSERNFEQGWCHRVGGRSGVAMVHGAPQYYWNLLRAPKSSWEHMREEDRESLQEYLQKYCNDDVYFSSRAREAGQDPMEYALETLEKLLQKHPRMHRYATVEDEPDQVYLMDLTDTPTLAQELKIDVEAVPVPPYRRRTIRSGYKVKKADEMPDFLTAEEGGLPCLDLLDRLRRYINTVPVAYQGGVWWEGRVYGGTAHAPEGLENHEYEKRPLGTILHLLQEARSATQKGRSVKVCGIEVPGLEDDLDLLPLMSVNIYRDKEIPGRIYRLMPGDTLLSASPQRAPYIVSCDNGVYMNTAKAVQGVHRMEDSFIPLNKFRAHMEGRAYMERHKIDWAQDGYQNALVQVMATNWGRGSEPMHDPSMMLEYLMRLTEDSGFERGLKGRQLTDCRPGEVKLLNVVADLLSMICGTRSKNPQRHLQELTDKYWKVKNTGKDMLESLHRLRVETDAERHRLFPGLINLDPPQE